MRKYYPFINSGKHSHPDTSEYPVQGEGELFRDEFIRRAGLTLFEYTASHTNYATYGYCWNECEDVVRGTQILLHMKGPKARISVTSAELTEVVRVLWNMTEESLKDALSEMRALLRVLDRGDLVVRQHTTLGDLKL